MFSQKNGLFQNPDHRSASPGSGDADDAGERKTVQFFNIHNHRKNGEAAMKNFDYGHLLGRAWNIVWKNKILWLFGFLAALGGEIAGNSSNLVNLTNQLSGSDVERWSEYMPPEWTSLIRQISTIDWAAAWVYIGIAVGGCLIVTLVLAVFSQLGLGGLVKSVQAAETGGAVSVQTAWAFGRKYFWRVTGIAVIEFSIRLFAALLIFAATLLILIPALLGSSSFLSSALIFPLLFCPLMCCFIFGILVISFYMYTAKLVVLLEDKPLPAAFSRAGAFLKRFIGPVLLLGAIGYVVSIGISFISLIVAAPVFIFFLAGLMPMINETGMVNTTFVYIGAALFLIQLPIGWLITSVWVSWENALYTLFYRRAAEIMGEPGAAASEGISLPGVSN
jgi:hypothetical protein